MVVIMRKLHREINECELWQLKQHYHNIVFTKSCYKIKFINDTVEWISSIGESYIFTKEEAINAIPPINEEQFISKCLSEVSLTLLTEGEPSKVIKYIVKLQNHEGNTHVFMDNNLFVCLLKAFILYHYSTEWGLNVAQGID